jgi:glycosyltransferase involved in cell wall biosynthesis
MLNSMDFVVVANDKCRKMAGQIVDDERKIHVIPAFIPPLDIPSLPPDGPIMQLKKKHRYLISSYAFNLSFHQGEDLYGIDMMIDLAARLTNDGLDFAFCLLLPNVNDIEYFNELTARIKALGIQDRFLVVTEPVRTASSLWRESSLVIRTTNTDGNSLSIPESLAVGVPVLASDCVPRPEGTLLFKSRDLEDLYLKTRDALSRLEEAKEQALLFRAEDNAIKLMELYKSLVNEDARGHRE